MCLINVNDYLVEMFITLFHAELYEFFNSHAMIGVNSPT